MAWGKAGSTTSESTGDDTDITSMTASIFIQILNHNLQSGNTKPMMTFNNDSGSRYSLRYDFNGGAASGGDVNKTAIWMFWAEPEDWDRFSVTYGCSISGGEKLQIIHLCEQNDGVGAGVAPDRMSLFTKYVPSDLTDTITRVDIHNDSSGNFDVGSNVSVLGSDMAPTLAVPFPTNVPTYSRFEETDTRKIYTKLIDGNWYTLGNLNPWSSTRGVFACGASYNTMQYITIATTGNATTFGSLVHGTREKAASCSSETRGVVTGGRIGSSNVDSMEYITIATTGNATDFGDLLGINYWNASCSNRTRGCIGGGEGGSSWNNNTIQYITIDTTGSATDFGDLYTGRAEFGALGNDTRGIWAGGGSNDNVIQYVTIATTGNSTDFGDLNEGKEHPRGVNSDTRGVFAGKGNTIQYITIATTGNATDFGDLTSSRILFGAVTSNTRGVFGGGGSNVMDYITIDTTGNATDFGDLSNTDDHQTGMDGS